MFSCFIGLASHNYSLYIFLDVYICVFSYNDCFLFFCGVIGHLLGHHTIND